MRVRVFWYPSDPSPADGECKTEAEAHSYAATRSAMLCGKVEVLSREGKTVATYVGGEKVS